MSNEFLIRKAVELAQFGQYQGARAILRALHEEEASNPQYWAARALAAETDRKAISYLEKIVELEPHNAWAQSQIRKLRRRQVKRRRAREAWSFWGRVIALHSAVYLGLILAAAVIAFVVITGENPVAPVSAGETEEVIAPAPATPTPDTARPTATRTRVPSPTPEPSPLATRTRRPTAMPTPEPEEAGTAAPVTPGGSTATPEPVGERPPWLVSAR